MMMIGNTDSKSTMDTHFPVSDVADAANKMSMEEVGPRSSQVKKHFKL